MMVPRLTEAKHISKYILHVRFADGSEGDVDLSQELNGPIFEPLKDVSYFQKASLSETIHTVVWPNGADFSPEYLYHRINESA